LEPIAPSAFEQALLEGVSMSWTAHSIDEDEIVGVAQVLGYQPVDRLAELSVACFAPRAGVAGEIVALAVDAAFRARDLRKLYFHLPEFAAHRFASTLSLYVEEEGQLQEFLWLDGRYQDVIVASIDRSDYYRMVSESPLAGMIDSDIAHRGYDDLAEFERLLDRLLSGRGDGPVSDVLADSLALIELLVALDDLAGRQIEVDALLALSTRQDLLAFAADVARPSSNDGGLWQPDMR